VKSIAVFTHPSKPEAKAAAEALRELASKMGMTVADERVEQKPDLIVALGGDGTILRAARAAHEADALLMGVNIGRLGFLSTVEAEHLPDALRLVAEGKTLIQKRMMLEAWGFSGDERMTALNEVVLERSTPARVVHIQVKVEDADVATFTADGFIVAAPSGSTAYSFSAGGPILEPEMRAMILSPVSPHHPLWRSSVVVDGERVIELVVVEGVATFSGDGDPVSNVDPGSKIFVRGHERPLKFAVPDVPGRQSTVAEFFAKVKTRLRLETREGEQTSGG
jgi:NAD+ kinase